jgi:hypothetical protein
MKASIQRCWSMWNVACTFLHTAEVIASNPMPLVGRAQTAKTLPKALPTDSRPRFRHLNWTRSRGSAATGWSATAP